MFLKFFQHIELLFSKLIKGITLVCITLVILNLIGLLDKFENIKYIGYVGSLTFFVWLTYILKTKDSAFKNKLAQTLEPILFGLIALSAVLLYLDSSLVSNTALLSFLNFNRISELLGFLLLISSGIILNLSYLNKDRLIELPNIGKIKGVVLLILILVFYTLFKISYFETSFTGLHTMKYNSYVEPAKYMVANKDFSFFQKKYVADPLSSPDGTLNHFGHLPIIEWMLALTYTLFPQLSLEFSTRLVMHVIGAFLLIFSYLTFSRLLGRTTALLTTFLISSIPVILFSTFVTVQDSLSLAFMFLGIIYLDKYLIQKNDYLLVISALVLGLGVAVKYNLALFAYIIYFILLFYKRKSFTDWYRDVIVLLTFSLIPFIVSKVSIEPMPGNGFVYSGVTFITLVILFFIVYQLYLKFKDNIFNVVQWIIKDKRAIFSLLIPPILIVVGMVSMVDIKFLASESLTDLRLLFNANLYHHMFFNQFALYMTTPLFYLSLITAPCLFFVKGPYRRYILTFVAGSSVYWLLASKVIFFHNYYTPIILITFALKLTLLPLLFTKPHYRVGAVIILALLALAAQTETSRILSFERVGFDVASEYLRSNTSTDEMYADESFTLSLTISTDRARLGQLGSINSPEIRDKILNHGFANTMNELGIKYLITEASAPDYQRWVVLFSEEVVDSTDYRRTDRIYERLYPEYKYYPDTEVRLRAVEEYDIKNKFHLETTIGGYKFYTFKN